MSREVVVNESYENATSAESHAVITRPLPVYEALRRMEQRKALLQSVQAPSESPEDRHSREAREADVVAAARRSQAEIRRHVDAYLKEHFEVIAADIAVVVVKQVHERLEGGMVALQESQQIALDRMAGAVRTQLAKFMRGFGKPAASPKKKAKR